MPTTLIEKKTAAKKQSDFDSIWNVVVHDDPVNLMAYVTLVFRRIFGYPETKATELMMEVHTKGRSIVWSGEREKAELFVQQLHLHLLMATLERAPLHT